ITDGAIFGQSSLCCFACQVNYRFLEWVVGVLQSGVSLLEHAIALVDSSKSNCRICVCAHNSSGIDTECISLCSNTDGQIAVQDCCIEALEMQDDDLENDLCSGNITSEEHGSEDDSPTSLGSFSDSDFTDDDDDLYSDFNDEASVSTGTETDSQTASDTGCTTDDDIGSAIGGQNSSGLDSKTDIEIGGYFDGGFDSKNCPQAADGLDSGNSSGTCGEDGSGSGSNNAGGCNRVTIGYLCSNNVGTPSSGTSLKSAFKAFDPTEVACDMTAASLSFAPKTLPRLANSTVVMATTAIFGQIWTHPSRYWDHWGSQTQLKWMEKIVHELNQRRFRYGRYCESIDQTDIAWAHDVLQMAYDSSLVESQSHMNAFDYAWSPEKSRPKSRVFRPWTPSSH
ncbi:hypothetical protein GGI05_003646, partial [Coemansia sp. RSA 2603]